MSKRKLLLADDSITIQKVVNLTFADEDIEIITAETGDAAMRKFVENTPDLVMIDVNLPDLSGFDICEMIKQDDATRHIPVVLLVGAFENFDKTEAQRVGADDFLTKPFPSIRELVETVTDLFEGKSLGDITAATVEKPIADLQTFEDIFEAEPENKYDTADNSIENLGEFINSDDEMIQTFPNADLRESKVSKFESFPITDSQPLYESFKENKNKNFYDEPLENEEKDSQIVSSPEKDFRDLNTSVENKNFESVLRIENNDLPETFDPQASIFITNNGEKQKNLVEANQFTKNEENFSPETIDAIAEKVADKLSDKLIKKIVRETIEQMNREK